MYRQGELDSFMITVSYNGEGVEWSGVECRCFNHWGYIPLTVRENANYFFRLRFSTSFRYYSNFT